MGCIGHVRHFNVIVGQVQVSEKGRTPTLKLCLISQNNQYGELHSVPVLSKVSSLGIYVNLRFRMKLALFVGFVVPQYLHVLEVRAIRNAKNFLGEIGHPLTTAL